MTINDYIKAKPLFEVKEINTKKITDLEWQISTKTEELLLLEEKLQKLKDDNTTIGTELDKI